MQINLALDRESVWVAKQAFKLAQRHMPKLRALLGVDREYLELSEKIAAKEAELSARPVMPQTENTAEDAEADPEKMLKSSAAPLCSHLRMRSYLADWSMR